MTEGKREEKTTLSKRLRVEEQMNRRTDREREIQRMNEDREREERREDALFSSISICTKLSLPPIWARSSRLEH